MTNKSKSQSMLKILTYFFSEASDLASISAAKTRCFAQNISSLTFFFRSSSSFSSSVLALNCHLAFCGLHFDIADPYGRFVWYLQIECGLRIGGFNEEDGANAVDSCKYETYAISSRNNVRSVIIRIAGCRKQWIVLDSLKSNDRTVSKRL